MENSATSHGNSNSILFIVNWHFYAVFSAAECHLSAEFMISFQIIKTEEIGIDTRSIATFHHLASETKVTSLR